MLINNKSLINTINKLNLTDDEREKFNKISEDDRGNFLYNGKPVIGGATEAQAAQIEANKTAIGDENSGLVKEVNNIKNTELQNLNTSIQTLETLVGVDETGLPSGDANIIASINRIDSKPSGTVTNEQISTAVNNYLTEHPVSNGATAEQVAQIQANTNAIGNESSGLIKEVNNIKNTELQNLNTAIQTLETLVGVDETVGDKNKLPVGDANIIASINRIDSKTSSDVIVTSEEGNRYRLVVNEPDGTLSAVKIEETTVNVTSVSIDKTNPSIKVDESTILTATITPSNATDKTVNWETNNSNVSLTPNGLNCTVRGVTEGSSIVTVTTNDGNHTATSNVTITAKESSGGDQPAGILDASCISYNESYTTYDGDNTFTFKTGLPEWNGLSVSMDSGVFKPSTQYTIYCQLLEEELPDDANNKVCTWGVDSYYAATGRNVLAGIHSTMKSITFTTKDDITPIPNQYFIFLQFTNQLTGYMKVKFYIVEG